MGWGSSHEGVGAKKFGMSFETQGNQTFLAGYPGILPDIPGVPAEFENKKFVFKYRPLFFRRRVNREVQTVN